MILGIIGIILPVLPTTPFFLLAAFCYMRSSKKLHDWLINHKVFGEYIYSYLRHRAIKKKAKISALIFLWATMLISIFILSNIYLQFMLVIIGAGASTYILSLKTLTDEMSAELAKQKE